MPTVGAIQQVSTVNAKGHRNTEQAKVHKTHHQQSPHLLRSQQVMWDPTENLQTPLYQGLTGATLTQHRNPSLRTPAANACKQPSSMLMQCAAPHDPDAVPSLSFARYQFVMNFILEPTAMQCFNHTLDLLKVGTSVAFFFQLHNCASTRFHISISSDSISRWVFQEFLYHDTRAVLPDCMVPLPSAITRSLGSWVVG